MSDSAWHLVDSEAIVLTELIERLGKYFVLLRNIKFIEYERLRLCFSHFKAVKASRHEMYPLWI